MLIKALYPDSRLKDEKERAKEMVHLAYQMKMYDAITGWDARANYTFNIPLDSDGFTRGLEHSFPYLGIAFDLLTRDEVEDIVKQFIKELQKANWLVAEVDYPDAAYFEYFDDGGYARLANHIYVITVVAPE